MNVNSPEFISNPYPFYDKRRSENPAFKRDETTWTLTGYEIISKVLAHSAIGRGNVGQKPQPNGNTTQISEIRDDNLALQVMDQWMLFQNPPEHTVSRNRISDVFTLKMINEFEELMRSVMRKRVTAIKRDYCENQPFDLIENIAYPYPVSVICEMIGIPKEDQPKFAQWTRDFSMAVQLDFVNIDPKLRSKLNQTASEVKRYFEQLISTKKQQGGDDLICRLIEASEGSLTHMQLISSSVFLLFAGQETTTLMISNTIHALLKHPEQLEVLRSNPALIKNAVEECLRYDTSTQMIGRFALDDIELGGLNIKKGDHIFAFLGAAGRDPDANLDPNTFDITREKIKHLAFARGAHHCLGASLARLELRVLLEELLDAFAHLSLAGSGKRRPTWLMRGFDALPLTYQNSRPKKDKKITIKLGSGLYPFKASELSGFTYQDYQLENVFENISDKQRHACVKMWMQHKVVPTKEIAWERSKQVCYIFTDLKSDDVIGVNTLYQSQFENSNQSYFFNRMYILPEHRNSRLMIAGTAAMLCYAKTHLSDRGAVGVINVNENKKLDRPGLQRIFNRLGYQHKEWKDNKEVILFEFDQVSYS